MSVLGSDTLWETADKDKGVLWKTECVRGRDTQSIFRVDHSLHLSLCLCLAHNISLCNPSMHSNCLCQFDRKIWHRSSDCVDLCQVFVSMIYSSFCIQVSAISDTILNVIPAALIRAPAFSLYRESKQDMVILNGS